MYICNLRAVAMGCKHPQLLFYNFKLNKLALSRCGFANYFATCEQLVLIYKTNYSLGCKKNIYIYIILLKKYVLSLTFSLITLLPVSQNSKALLSQLSTLLLGLNLRNSFLSQPSLVILMILGGGFWWWHRSKFGSVTVVGVWVDRWWVAWSFGGWIGNGW